MKDSKLLIQNYNKKYYLRNREALIKRNAEYQKNPINVLRRKNRIRWRYKNNHLNFKDKNLRSHDRLKQTASWWIKQRARISIWGIKNRSSKINKERWEKYYLENKEKYKEKRRKDKSLIISKTLRRIEYNRNIPIIEIIKDVKILQNEINLIKIKQSHTLKSRDFKIK